MWFRKEKSGKIAVLAYAGYDRAKKAPIVQKMGTISGVEFSSCMGRELSDDQKKELEEYLLPLRGEKSIVEGQRTFDRLPELLAGVAAMLAQKNELEIFWAEGVWDGWEKVGRELRRLGYGQKAVRKQKKSNKSNKEATR